LAVTVAVESLKLRDVWNPRQGFPELPIRRQAMEYFEDTYPIYFIE
jgi:hypothetical protein